MGDKTIPAHILPENASEACSGRTQRTRPRGMLRTAPLSYTAAEVFVSHNHFAAANNKIMRDRLQNTRKTNQNPETATQNTKLPRKTPPAAEGLAPSPPSIRALTFLEQNPKRNGYRQRKQQQTRYVCVPSTRVTVLPEEFSRSLRPSECSLGRTRWNLPHLLPPLLPTRHRHAHSERTRHGQTQGRYTSGENSAETPLVRSTTVGNEPNAAALAGFYGAIHSGS